MKRLTCAPIQTSLSLFGDKSLDLKHMTALRTIEGLLEISYKPPKLSKARKHCLIESEKNWVQPQALVCGKPELAEIANKKRISLLIFFQKGQIEVQRRRLHRFRTSRSPYQNNKDVFGNSGDVYRCCELTVHSSERAYSLLQKHMPALRTGRKTRRFRVEMLQTIHLGFNFWKRYVFHLFCFHFSNIEFWNFCWVLS